MSSTKGILLKITGNDLRRFRVYKGFDQKNAAALLGITQPAYSKWEKNLHLSEKKMQRVFIAFSTSAEEMDRFMRI